MDCKKGLVKNMSEGLIRLIIFASGLFIGMFGGVAMMSLMTMAKISDLREEIGLLKMINDSKKDDEEDSIGLTE